MRVVVIFDGKNFYSGLKSAVGVVRLDFPKLADWLIARTGGTVLWGAHYYTGIERGDEAESEGQKGLVNFLNALELQPGYFVHRFARRADRRRCPHCQQEIRFTQEKEVDTTIVADMLRLAAVDGFDILVLVSGDADLAPAVENVRSLGKKVYVATWGRDSLAPRLRQACFDHIDLRAGLDDFRAETVLVGSGAPSAPGAASVRNVAGVEPDVSFAPTPGSGPASIALAAIEAQEVDPEVAERSFLAALENAESKFAGGYVGLHFFLTNWRFIGLDPDKDVRQRLLDRLVGKNAVETFNSPDGKIGVRRIRTGATS